LKKSARRETVLETGNATINFPTSTDIESPGNKLQTALFFYLQPEKTEKQSGVFGSAAVAGSLSVSHSFVSLKPNSKMRVLLPASTQLIQSVLDPAKKSVELRIVCSEWRLDDNRYLLRATSQKLESVNTIKFSLNGSQVVTVEE
jgi:hypothetical protein